MKSNRRFFAYFIGFAVGSLLVSWIVMRRAAEKGTERRGVHEARVGPVDSEPLPDTVRPALSGGRIIGFGYWPNRESPKDRVWILRFTESYPHVRIAQNMANGTLTYMAADQIRIRLAGGVDVADLSPLLERLGLRLRNFNRKHGVVVVGTLDAGVNAVPRTLEALRPWSELFASVGPDALEFSRKRF